MRCLHDATTAAAAAAQQATRRAPALAAPAAQQPTHLPGCRGTCAQAPPRPSLPASCPRCPVPPPAGCWRSPVPPAACSSRCRQRRLQEQSRPPAVRRRQEQGAGTAPAAAAWRCLPRCRAPAAGRRAPGGRGGGAWLWVGTRPAPLGLAGWLQAIQKVQLRCSGRGSRGSRPSNPCMGSLDLPIPPAAAWPGMKSPACTCICMPPYTSHRHLQDFQSLLQPANRAWQGPGQTSLAVNTCKSPGHCRRCHQPVQAAVQ